MPHSINSRRLGGVIVLMVVVATGCSRDGTTRAERASTTTSSELPRPDTDSDGNASSTPRPIPQPGACLEPMIRELSRGANLPEIVPCDGPHGGEIIDVWDLPEATADQFPVINGRLVGIDSATQRCISADASSGAYVDFAGDNRLDTAEAETAVGVTDAWRVSGVTPAVFVPGPAGWARGERWVACAAVLDNTTAPAQTTETMRGAFAQADSLNAAFTWCKLQLDPEDRNNFDVVACDDEHTHEQVASFRIAATGERYPGEDVVSAQTETVCPILAAQATGGRSDELPEEFGLAWTYPIVDDWAQGDLIARCFIVSTGGPTTGSVAAGTARPTG